MKHDAMNTSNPHQQVAQAKERMRGHGGPVFVPAFDPLDLPPRTPHETLGGDAGPIVVPVAQRPTPAATRSFKGIQGTPVDEAKALGFRFAIVLGLEALTLAGLAFIAWANSWIGIAGLWGGWVVLTAAIGIASWVVMERQDHQHSPAGAERHRVTEDEKTERERIYAHERVQTHAIDRYFDALEREHERTHEERQRLIGERLRLSD